jgi:hypothetical protein
MYVTLFPVYCSAAQKMGSILMNSRCAKPPVICLWQDDVFFAA